MDGHNEVSAQRILATTLSQEPGPLTSLAQQVPEKKGLAKIGGAITTLYPSASFLFPLGAWKSCYLSSADEEKRMLTPGPEGIELCSQALILLTLHQLKA